MATTEKGKGEYATVRAAVWTLVMTAALYAMGVLAAAALICGGVMEQGQGGVFLIAAGGAAAFCATAFSAFLSRKQLLRRGLLAQGVFVGLLLLAGMTACEGMMNWPRMAATLLAMLAGAAVAAALLGKRKKKDFRKNAAIRLKKR
jgi:hypothetical protein